MKSFRGSNNSLVNTFQTLSLNATASNGSLGTILINDGHRYLLQKYFDNERSVYISTIGSESLAMTNATLPAGATSATLTSAWGSTRPSVQQYAVFSDGEQRTVNFIQGSTAITWSPALNKVQTKASLATVGVQAYPIPANVSKIKNGTITVGQLVYSPAPVQSIQEWTKLNAMPYSSELPAYFFIYAGQINFFPIPSTTGDVITLNAQVQVPDMTYSDYTTGTISLSPGSETITGSGTTWSSSFPTGVDLTYANIFLIPTPPNGDGFPYQIQSFASDTTATLVKPIVYAPKTSLINYTIGQYPYLTNDFQDIPLYWALKIYFSSIVKNADSFKMYSEIYQEKLEQMKAYLSTKQVNVDLSATPIQQNPNLFIYSSN